MFRPSSVRTADAVATVLNGLLPIPFARKSSLITRLRNCSIYEPLEARQLMSVSVTTARYDNARDAANTSETILTTSNVNSSSFGKIASMGVDGQIYAQPLVVANVAIPGKGTHDVVYVATEADSIYAFDAHGNNPATGYLWKTSMLQAGETTVPASDYNTSDITTQYGVTGTPVIDPATNTLYVVGVFKETNATYVQRIYALDTTTGAVKFGGPVTIAASTPGTGSGAVNGTVAFSAYVENQRPALTLANGEVYVAWASHGDLYNWHGWVIGFNAATLHEDYAYCNTPNGAAGGIWMSGGGIAVDSSGNLYFSTGNGDFDANTGGLDYGMTIQKVSPSLAPIDYFAPYNQASLSNGDLDYGCSSVILLPTQTGTNPNQVLTESKWGTMYLNSGDTGSMGEFNASTNSDLGEANITTNVTTSNMHNTFAYWNGHAYVAGDGLKMQSYNVSGGALSTSPSSTTTNAFGSTAIEDGQGAAPTVSSNGTSNGIVWAVDNSGFLTNPAILYAYNANNLSQMLYSSSQAANSRDKGGTAIKFQSAVVANGSVYIAGMNSVTIYGLLTSSTATPTLVTAAAANPTSTTGTTSTLSVLGSDPGADLIPNYTWAATTVPSGGAVTFSINATNNANNTVATFNKAGTYTLTATIEDPNSGLTVTSSVNVAVTQTLTSVSITPVSASLNNGGTQQFSATAKDQFGNAMTSQPTFAWTVSSGGIGGTITAGGLYSAPAAGSGIDTVTASASGLSSSVSVLVALPQSTTQVDLSSLYSKVGIVPDGSTFTGGLDGVGSAFSGNLLGTTQTWNGSSFAIAAATSGNSVNNVVSCGGQTLSLNPGRDSILKILATRTNGSATASFSVNYADGTSLVVSQGFSDWSNGSYTAYTGQSKAIAMSYRDTSGGTKDNRQFNVYGYSIALNSSKIINSITLPADSQIAILAIDTFGLSAPTITAAASATPSTVVGTFTNLSASATDTSGDASPTYTWSVLSQPGGIAAPTFSVNGTTASANTAATFHGIGVYTFAVTVADPTNKLTNTSTVSVTVEQTLSSITVAPSTQRIYDAGTQQFTATGLDQFGAVLASQPVYFWSVNSGGAGGSIDANGLYTAPSTGTGTDMITVNSGGKSGTATATVVSPKPTITSAASASPSTVTLTTTSLSVLATDASGDAGPSYTWTAIAIPSGAATPTFSVNSSATASTTIATFYKAGSYTFTATITDPTTGGISTSNVAVTVQQSVASIAVSPLTVSLLDTATQQFAASAVDQFGNTFATQPAFAWSVATGGVGGTINANSGLYTAPSTGAGTDTVKATAGGISGTATVTVASGKPTISNPAAASPSTVTGTTTSLTVLATDAAGDGGSHLLLVFNDLPNRRDNPHLQRE